MVNTIQMSDKLKELDVSSFVSELKSGMILRFRGVIEIELLGLKHRVGEVEIRDLDIVKHRSVLYDIAECILELAKSQGVNLEFHPTRAVIKITNIVRKEINTC